MCSCYPSICTWPLVCLRRIRAVCRSSTSQQHRSHFYTRHRKEDWSFRCRTTTMCSRAWSICLSRLEPLSHYSLNVRVAAHLTMAQSLDRSLRSNWCELYRCTSWSQQSIRIRPNQQVVPCRQLEFDCRFQSRVLLLMRPLLWVKLLDRVFEFRWNSTQPC